MMQNVFSYISDVSEMTPNKLHLWSTSFYGSQHFACKTT